MRIAIKAAQIAPGGGLTHLNKIIEWFGRLAPESEFMLIGKRGQENLFIPPPSNFRYEFYKAPSINLATQIWWERHVLPGILKDNGADLLFEPGNRGTLKPPCPKITLIHNIAPFNDEYLRHETPYQKLRQRLLRRATLESMKVSDGIIFLSEYTRRIFSDILDLSQIKNAVIYHGGLDTSNSPGAGHDLAKYGIIGDYILNVSHIWRYKKVMEMVQAYHRALEKKPDIPQLVIAGENYSPAYWNEIKAFLRDKQIHSKVRYIGSVPSGDLVSLYRNCTAFIFPSVLETISIILIEAMTAGCAIGCANRGVMPEIAGAAALYFNPDDIDDFCHKIVSLIEDKNLNDALRRNSLERSAHFSWEKTARETLDFFADILGSPRTTTMAKTPKRELVEA